MTAESAYPVAAFAGWAVGQATKAVAGLSRRLGSGTIAPGIDPELALAWVFRLLYPAGPEHPATLGPACLLAKGAAEGDSTKADHRFTTVLVAALWLYRVRNRRRERAGHPKISDNIGKKLVEAVSCRKNSVSFGSQCCFVRAVGPHALNLLVRIQTQAVDRSVRRVA